MLASSDVNVYGLITWIKELHVCPQCKKGKEETDATKEKAKT